MEKTCTINNYKKQIGTELDEIEKALIPKNTYGGFEGKLEDGKLVYFKYWVGKKL